MSGLDTVDKSRTTCILWFHQWGKWTTYKQDMVRKFYIDPGLFGRIDKIDVPEPFYYTVTRQNRQCKRCGKTQDVSVKK